MRVELDAGRCITSCRGRVVVHDVFDLRQKRCGHVAVPDTMSVMMPKMKPEAVATRTDVRVAGRAIDHRPVQLAIRLTLTPRGAVSAGSWADVQVEEPQWVEHVGAGVDVAKSGGPVKGATEVGDLAGEAGSRST